MKRFVVLTVICLAALNVQAQLETNLMREIKAWRKGDVPPARLLKFPEGNINEIAMCGLTHLGSEVSHYIWQIQDAELLSALIFDYRAGADTFQAAASRLITLKGVEYVSRVFAERRQTQPDAFARTELAVLSQLLRTPYVAIQVARISPDDLPPERAERALEAMRVDLQAGTPWAAAHRKHADLHPDVRDREKNPGSVRTLISYLYDGTVSPTGFDIAHYRLSEALPAEHLRELFRLKKGTHIFKANEGVYLYSIGSYFDGAK